MKKYILYIALASPAMCFSQAELVINGASPVAIVESGGTKATPIYIDINNPANTGIVVTGGAKGIIQSETEFDMVKWDIGTSGAGKTYLVPFGDSLNPVLYLPLSMTITTAGSPATASVLFSSWHTYADNWTTPSPHAPPSDVTNMNAQNPPGSPSNTDNSYNAVDRFWVIDPGASGFAYTTKPTLSSIVFSYNSSGAPLHLQEMASPNVFAESSLIAQRFNSGIGNWGDYLGPGGTWLYVNPAATVSTGTISPANFFRSWTLTAQNSPLPVSVTSFNAVCVTVGAEISWTSATEINSAYYTVEKSADLVHWEPIATRQAAGNSDFPINYATPAVIDNNPYPTTYYMLEETDIDYTTHIAANPISFTNCAPNTGSILAYNAGSYIEVQVNAVNSDNYQFSLTNMLGQNILNSNNPVSQGANTIQLYYAVPPGIYILYAHNNNGTINYTKKIVLGVN